ncbi:MAG TPA: alpha/beta hydrolase [Nocardioidaceae bacterium]|nr:alpha/beta hydrolase [Nocardioidaceae bacterium]
MFDVFAAMEAWRRRAEAPVLRMVLRLPSPVLRLVAGRRVTSQGQMLDPQMQMLLRMQRLAGGTPVERLALPAGRRALARQCRTAGGGQPIGAVRDLVVGGLADMRLYTPTDVDEPAPLLLFLHGGGFVYGDLDSHDAVCRYLAQRSGAKVLAVDYRRAPEHPFPAAVDDCFAAYTWARAHPAELGIDPERIALGGDSAGGNLATAICLRARDGDVPQPRLQVLLYPVTDFTQELASRSEYGEGFWLTEEFITRCRAAYLQPETDPSDPLLSPLQTKDLAGLAPAYVETAGFDPLRDEGAAYARRLADDGVTVELHRRAGLIHGYATMVGISSSARAAMRAVAAHLRTRL